MINEYTQLWADHQSELLQRLREEPRWSYLELFKLLIEVVINKGEHTLCLGQVTQLDHGDYQGTMVFIVPDESYQPYVDDYIYTHVYYGSCAGCDTLEAIRDDYENKEQQAKDLHTLCLHLLQRCKRLIP
jgi:hypothetical protein